MRKYFIVSDVHSFYDEMMEALAAQGFNINNPNHIFVSLGDLLDRGPDPLKCLKFVNSLPDDRKLLIRGNHEDLMEDAIVRREFLLHDIHNGTYETCCNLTNIEDIDISDSFILEAMRSHSEWNKYIKSCVDFYQINDNIFVHGWIPLNGEGNNREEILNDWVNGNWYRARWYNGMQMWSYGLGLEGKTIYCGHYHCSWGNARLHDDGKEFLERIETYYYDKERGCMMPYVNFKPFKDEGIVAMDACTVVSGFCNCEVIEID